MSEKTQNSLITFSESISSGHLNIRIDKGLGLEPLFLAKFISQVNSLKPRILNITQNYATSSAFFSNLKYLINSFTLIITRHLKIAFSKPNLNFSA
jgi:hypothetical protein